LLYDGVAKAEVGETVKKTREHTARLMKALFDEGLVTRDHSARPCVYRLTVRGRAYLDSWEV